MQIVTIAHIHTPFSEKFAIPRQAGISMTATGVITLTENYRQAAYLDGLQAHSHYWLVWGFHQHTDKEKTPTVRPPRLGGNQRVGVFATRSPFRPNNLGLSVVKLAHVDARKFSLTVSGVDMLDGSPIYDIKPYIPYADCQKVAISQWAADKPAPQFNVAMLPEVVKILCDYEVQTNRSLLVLIRELLSYDMRPSYKSNRLQDDKVYATQLYDVDVAWSIAQNTVTVISAKVIVDE